MGFASKIFVKAAETFLSMEKGNFPQNSYRFLGMASIMDTPREDAGIKMFTVNGDHPTTAAVIA
jgi:hypothetical protein